MDAWEREYHAARVASGVTRVLVGGEPFWAHPPGRVDRLRAQEVYRDALAEARLRGLLDADAAPDVLRARGLWTAKDQDEYDALPTNIENLKVGLFEAWNDASARRQARQYLDLSREELGRLSAALHQLDHATAEGVAAASRARYLAVCSLRRRDGSPLWPDPDAGWSAPDRVAEEVVSALSRERLSEAAVRELARTEPWRSVWAAARHCGGPFGTPAADLTDEQRGLVLWSSTYDSVRDHPDRPSDDVVDDDDMLDGWMIVQRRRHEANALKKRGDEIGNEKIRNSGEVFILAKSGEDARRVEGLNDGGARAIKAQRLAHLKAMKSVNEMDMPDTALRYHAEANAYAARQAKGK